MNNLILHCEKLTKKFFDGRKEIVVLDELSLTLAKQERIAITGSSGSGKTTLLQILGSLDKPTSGKIIFNEQDITHLSQAEKTKMRNQKIGFVYQFHHLLPEFSALENVCMPLLIQGIPFAAAKKSAGYLLERVGLQDRMTHKPGELSGGERQRTAIARALITHPDCVLADEPTGNLDTGTAQRVIDTMQSLNEEFKTSFVIVTHDSRLAGQMDKVYALEKGKLSLK